MFYKIYLTFPLSLRIHNTHSPLLTSFSDYGLCEEKKMRLLIMAEIFGMAEDSYRIMCFGIAYMLVGIMFCLEMHRDSRYKKSRCQW